MAKKIEFHDLKIKSLEDSEEKDKIRCYYSYRLGESYFDVSKYSEDYKHVSNFLPGEEYIGEFVYSGIPDFVGEEDTEKNICTWSSELERIVDEKGNILFGSYEDK